MILKSGMLISDVDAYAAIPIFTNIFFYYKDSKYTSDKMTLLYQKNELFCLCHWIAIGSQWTNEKKNTIRIWTDFL